MAKHPEYLPLYRALVEYAQDLLGILDLAGSIRYLSPAAQGIVARRPRELIDQPLEALVHSADRDIVHGWLRRLATSRERELCEARLGQPEHWRRLSLSGIRVQEDETSEVIVLSGHDITEEVEASRALAASEQRFHGAFDYSPIGKALLAADGAVVECNRALADMLGCWVGELIGSNLPQRFETADAALLRADCAALMERRQVSVERELRLAGPQERRLWVLLNIAPIWDDHGQLEHFIVQLQDITARREAEQALRESHADLLRSNEELKRFAFIASHDLREPLRGIGGSLQLIARRYREALGEDGQALAEQAVGGVKRLQALLDDLVVYTEQMRGGDFERAAVATGALVDELAREFAPRLETAGARLEVDRLPTVLGDAGQIRQVFQQLLDNALKYGVVEAGQAIRIGARWARDVWEFTVADDGPGIGPDYQEQIFEVFRRLETGGEGTGMGLATVRKMVERHGGRIWVESAPGQGACFHFTLPPE